MDHRIPLVGTAIAAAGLLIALAATLGPTASSDGAAGASLVVRLPDPVRMTVLTLLALSALLLLALQRWDRRRASELALRREERRLPSWLAALLSLPIVVPVVALAYLLWTRSSTTDGDGDTPFAVIARLLDLLTRARKPETSVPLFDLGVATVALATALAMFALLVLVALADRHARRAALDAPAASAAAGAGSVDDLRTEPDARRAIVRAWATVERALGAVEVRRAPWQTPSEFMRSALAHPSVPRAPAGALTTLYELARFSDRPLGADARDRACECVEAIDAAVARWKAADRGGRASATDDPDAG
jgi:hypothetical protein